MRYYSFLIVLIIYGCQSNTKELPILSYKINSEGENIEYAISYKNFSNEMSKAFSTEKIKNKVFIANFFFTRCPSICPPMRMHLIKIAETFQEEDDFMIISHTIDPKNDTEDILKKYSKATKIPINKWQFLRASEDNTRKQANQYMTNFRPNDADTDFYHSSYVALVDKNQLIRGFYNVLVDEEVKRLINDINLLLN